MKKILCVVLVVVISLQLSVFVSAKTNSLVVSTEDRSRIISALRDTEYIKNEMGLETVDFENIYISGSIKSYAYTTNGFVELNEHIPLFSDNKLIAHAVNVDGQFHISTYLVQMMNKAKCNMSDYAFVYDANSVYVYDGANLILLADSGSETEGRAKINSAYDLVGKKIDTDCVTERVFLGYMSHSQPRIPVYYSCNVSYVPQGNEYLCWAASVACIVNYKQNQNLTAAQVAIAYKGSDYNDGIYFGEESDVLALYGLSYLTLYRFPSENDILVNIQNQYPVYATCRARIGATDDHDVVIYAINISSGRLYVMDPNSGSATAYYDSSTNHYHSYSTAVGLRHNFIYASLHEWSV